MKPISRRRFLHMAGAAVAGATLGPATRLFAKPDETPDLLLRNGVILTMDDSRPQVSAMAIRSGRVLAVGDDRQINALAGSRTQILDLAGKGVSPGLIDAHSHLIAFGHMELKFVILRPPRIVDFDSLRTALREAAAKKPEGQWIVGRGFQDFKEGRFPHRQELDEAVPNHPLLIIHWGGQYGIANTLALEKAGLLTKDVPDPYGGRFLREPGSGLPNGVLIHYPAIYAVHQPRLSEEEQIKCAAWAVEQFAGAGVTCIHDNFVLPPSLKTYAHFEQSGQLKLRLRAYPYVANLPQAERVLSAVMRYSGPLVRLQGIKLAVDGYALMHQTADSEPLGPPMHPQPVFESIVAAIHRSGLQADVHAVGDQGVDWTLAAFEKAAGGVPAVRERRHRIEHFPFRKVDSIAKAAAMNVPVCVQPTFIDFRADDFARRLVHPAKGYLDAIVPMRTFLDEGVPLALGADVPAFPYFSPLDSIRCAMQRKTGAGRQLDQSQSISFLEALRVHTLGSAYAAMDEKELGSLEVGKAADFVIWNRDLRQVRSAADIGGLHARATYVGGRCIHQAGA